MEVAKPLLNLRNNSCRSVTNISAARDNFISAFGFFSAACDDDKIAACFHVALLEEDRGNLALSLNLMKPLCDRNYIIHKNVHSSGCTEYKRMQRAWGAQHPKQARAGSLQLIFLGTTLVLILASFGARHLRHNASSLLLSGLAILCYLYYESGVSIYASIRIDLLLLIPMLLWNLGIFFSSLSRLTKRK